MGMSINQEDHQLEVFCVLCARGFLPEEAVRRAAYPFEGDWSRQSARLLARQQVRRKIARYAKELDFLSPVALARAGLQRVALGESAELPGLLREEEPLPAGVPLLQVAEVKSAKNGGLEIKLVDRLKALELLASMESPQPEATSSLVEALVKSAQALEENHD